ncbi:restriction endonuclease subunit S [Intestinibacter sp.]|uniref:restriction endonuclease subunit S n=1 Tax=Intestinibacter sp. TaxID=1965304 RepID=UPI002A914073|nr:restriction endonuclease subunit S [Intestinibacter sp.]MDY5211130.1 restriction endonuclease subunit S [Intestinibacter sp.]
MVYKLGDLVEQVTETNFNLKYGLDNIVGVTIEKEMIPTIANLTQTNLAKFIVVKPFDFVYNPRTHGKKIGLGYNTTNRYYITTWNNNIFHVKESMKNIVLPDYLYMYFKRDRWDKEACFNAWGSSTVVLLWSSFCEMKINLPSIEEQRKIVHDYKVVTDRIELLKKINDNLAEIEQAILVKSLSENSTSPATLGELVEFIDGDRGKNYPTFDEFTSSGYCLFLNASNVTASGFNFDTCMFVTEEKDKEMNNGHLSPFDIVLTSRGTLGNLALYDSHIRYKNVRINSGMLIIRPKSNRLSPYFIYGLLKSNYMKIAIEQFRSGSAQPQLPIKDLQKISFEIPNSDELISVLNRQFVSIEEQISVNKSEIDNLKELSNVILAELSC